MAGSVGSVAAMPGSCACPPPPRSESGKTQARTNIPGNQSAIKPIQPDRRLLYADTPPDRNSCRGGQAVKVVDGLALKRQSTYIGLIMTIPNIITIIRFLLVPLVVWGLISGEYMVAFIGFMIAGISDGVDGFIARQFNQRSELGAWIDPAADKLLLVSVFVLLGWLGELPNWLVLLFVSRDVLIIGAIVLSSLMGTTLEMRPILVSKANTVAQIALAALVLAELALLGTQPEIRTVLVWVAAFLTLASGIAYVLSWARIMSAETPGETKRP
jgi:cardiolipin synthase (CMP-forming)